MEEMRINKYLSTMGYCSRREADRLIEDGRVMINGDAAVPGSRLYGGEKVTVDGKLIGRPEDAAKVKRVVIAVNKPKGVVCTTSDNDKAVNIVELVNYPERVYPIGRLDKDSEGLILMTNDGDLVNEILKSSNYHEKEYEVEVDRPITEAALKKMRDGMYLKELDKSTRPCEIERTGARTFNIILTQGLNRQIRRMCEECGYQVIKLRRIRIMGVRLGSIKDGKWKKINPEWLN